MQNYLTVFPVVAVQIKKIENEEIHTVEGDVFRPQLGDEYLSRFNPAEGGFYVLVGDTELYVCEDDFLSHFDAENLVSEQIGAMGAKYVRREATFVPQVPPVAEAVVTEDVSSRSLDDTEPFEDPA